MTESDRLEPGRESELSVQWNGLLHTWFGRLRFLRRARPVVILDNDGFLRPFPVGVGIGRGAFSDASGDVLVLTAAGNAAPAWPVLPSSAIALWKISAAIYNSGGIIAAPGVSLLDGTGLSIGPTTGVTAAGQKFDLLPKSEVLLTQAESPSVLSGTAGDTWTLRLVRVS